MRSIRSIGAVLVVALLVLVPTAVTAGSAVGSFEIDGNTLDDSGPGEPIDWSTPPPNMVSFTDPTGATDNTFGSGAKENTPNLWDFVTSPASDKADITSGAIAFRKIGAETFVYLNFTRVADNGSTFANFEFNQSDATYVNSIGETVPVRTVGDLLIGLFSTQGGQGLVVELRQWTGNHLAGSWSLLGSCAGGSADCDVAVGANAQGRWTFAEAALRLTAFFSPGCPGFGKAWIKTTSSPAFETSALQDYTFQQNIDLSNCAHKTFSFTVGPKPIAGTKVFAVYTLGNSQTRTLELEDSDNDGTYTATDDDVPAGTLTWHFEVRNGNDLVYASPEDSETLAEEERRTNSGSLTYGIDLTPASAENYADNTAHTLTARVFNTADDTGLPNVPVQFAVTSSTPPGCATLSAASGVTGADGNASTTLNSSGSGCTSDVRAFVDGSGGSSGTFDDGEASADGTKAWAVYALTVGNSGVNERGEPHTFAVTLTRDVGSGAQPLSGATVSFVLSNGGGSTATITAISPAGPDADSCTTDANGQCSVTVSGSTAGTATLSASYLASNSDGERTITSDGTKEYVDASIAIAHEGSDTNEVGSAHTFEVTVTALPAGAEPVTFDSIGVAVSGSPQIVSDTCGTPSVEGNVATCQVTINSSSAGTFTANASAVVTMGGVSVTRSTAAEGNSGPGGSGPATKGYVDASIAIGPSGVNEVGDPHTFTVTVTASPQGTALSFDSIAFSVSPDPDSATSTCGEPAVDGSTATCTVTINSDSTGSFTVNATAVVTMGGVTVTRSTDGNTGPDGSGPATKTYFSIDLTKNSCPTSAAPRGGLVEYGISFAVTGSALTNAVLVESIPAEIVLVGPAPAIAGVSPVVTSSTVTWTFPVLEPGTYSATIQAQVKQDVDVGTEIENTVTFAADEVEPPHTAGHTITVTDGGKAASGRAFGVSVDLLGDGLLLGDPDLAPTPDSDVSNPGGALSIADPLGGSDPLVGLLRVSETDQSDADTAAYEAIAHAVDVNLTVPGIVTVEADAVLARSASRATIVSAGSTRAGSTLLNVRINGETLGDVTEPVTVRVTDPISGAELAKVYLLETIGGGAAGGVAQPNGDLLFDSELTVKGIHVVVNDIAGTPLNEASDIVVSHAQTSAAYPSGLGCGASTPAVSGRAFALKTVATAGDDDALDAEVGRVDLPITGGSQTANLAEVETGVGSVGAFTTGTEGETTDDDGDGEPIEATSAATTASINLLAGAVSAKAVEATAHSDTGGSTGATVVADLQIAGIDVCDALGLNGSTCRPEPNSPLLFIPGTIVLLNEQIPEPGGLTVNGVHIWILGSDNPLNLPAGVEIIISQAHADAHPASSNAPQAAAGLTVVATTVSVHASVAKSESGRSTAAAKQAAPAVPAAPAPLVAPANPRSLLP